MESKTKQEYEYSKDPDAKARELGKQMLYTMVLSSLQPLFRRMNPDPEIVGAHALVGHAAWQRPEET